MSGHRISPARARRIWTVLPSRLGMGKGGEDMNPRSGLVGLVAAATFVFAGCGGGTSAPSGAKTYNLWYVNPLPNTPDWGRSSKLFQQRASAGGYKATL